MTQYIIVIIIIAAALAYTIYATVKSITRKKNESACGGCKGCEIKEELTKNHPTDFTDICGGPK